MNRELAIKIYDALYSKKLLLYLDKIDAIEKVLDENILSGIYDKNKLALDGDKVVSIEENSQTRRTPAEWDEVFGNMNRERREREDREFYGTEDDTEVLDAL